MYTQIPINTVTRRDVFIHVQTILSQRFMAHTCAAHGSSQQCSPMAWPSFQGRRPIFMLHHHTAPVSIQAHKGSDVPIPVSTSPAILSHFARYSPSSPQTGSLSQLLRLPAAQKRRAVAFLFPSRRELPLPREGRSRLHSAHRAQSRLRPGPRGERPWGGLRAPPAWSTHPSVCRAVGSAGTAGAAGVSATCLAPPEPACPRPQAWLWR